MSRDKILERIHKLLRVARGQANEHESATAARAAARLMQEHQIEESEVMSTKLTRAPLSVDVLASFSGLWYQLAINTRLPLCRPLAVAVALPASPCGYQ